MCQSMPTACGGGYETVAGLSLSLSLSLSLTLALSLSLLLARSLPVSVFKLLCLRGLGCTWARALCLSLCHSRSLSLCLRGLVCTGVRDAGAGRRLSAHIHPPIHPSIHPSIDTLCTCMNRPASASMCVCTHAHTYKADIYSRHIRQTYKTDISGRHPRQRVHARMRAGASTGHTARRRACGRASSFFAPPCGTGITHLECTLRVE